MIKTYLSALLLLITSLSLLAQTELIAHKSHSGTVATFNNSFLNDGLGFGEAPQRYIETAILDSVIYVSDSVAIMVTSNYCTTGLSRFKEHTLEERMRNAELWSAGRDTVYNHPLFSKQHQLDTIKAKLDATYYFNNSADKVKFIGYDNGTPLKKVKKKRMGFVPLILPGNDHTPFDFHMAIAITVIAIFSVLAGLLLQKLHQFKVLVSNV